MTGSGVTRKLCVTPHTARCGPWALFLYYSTIKPAGNGQFHNEKMTPEGNIHLVLAKELWELLDPQLAAPVAV